MRVRRLNSTGLTKFKAFLEESRLADSPVEVPVDILSSPATSAGLNVTVEIEAARGFSSKMELARYLNEVLSPLSRAATLSHNGMWSWLGLFMFETLCPVNPRTGLRRIYQDWYYIFQPDDALPNYRTYYRHLLYTPYHIYRTFEGRAGRALLSGRADVGGDMSEQIASRQEYISCRAVLEAVDHLYLGNVEEVERLKRGATSDSYNGNVRRLVDFLQQIDATYDLYGMSGENILSLLPPEFDEWK